MNLITIKELYKLLTTSDNIFDVRGKLHRACDKVDSDEVTKEYLASENIIRMINFIKKEYDSMIEAEKTAYRISDEELQLRINKLKKIDEIFKTYNNPYIRFDKLLKMFKNPSIMHKSYTLLIRYGKDDPKWDEIRPLLKNFNIYFNEFRNSYKNDIHKTVANVYIDESEQDMLKYARFIVGEYITKEDSFMFNDFIKRYGIDKKTFESLMDMIKKHDLVLYYEYVIKKDSNEKQLHFIYTNIIDDLNYAVTNKEFVYGNKFDTLEFIKQIPFKDDDFVTNIDDFMALHCKFPRERIMNYIKENGLDRDDAFKIYNPEELLKARIIVSGITLSEKEINKIINYLYTRSIPLYKSAFGIAAKMYLNNELDNIMLNKNFNIEKEICPILIPNYKKH